MEREDWGFREEYSSSRSHASEQADYGFKGTYAGSGSSWAFGLQLNMQVRYSAQPFGLSLAHVSFSRGVKYSPRRAVVTKPVCVCCQRRHKYHIQRTNVWLCSRLVCPRAN